MAEERHTSEVMPSRATLDLLDDLVRPTVMVRAAGGEW